MGTLQASIAMSEAGQADLGVATNGLVKVMNAYSYSADQAMFASDVFTQTVGMGVGSMNEFVGAMIPIAGLAASVGVGFDELGSAMAYSTSKGQTASVAATQMRTAMIALLNPNESMIKALQTIGIESGSAMIKEFGLAESLNMVNGALGGSQDVMSKALGSTEALQAAVALTATDYVGFATSFGEGIAGTTDSARSIQLESLESKMARLEVASTSLKTQIGNDINRIKGVFVGVETVFLQHVALPIMNSPVGSVFSNIAAGTGILTQGVLEVGSGAINTAAQLSVLAANVQNAGGYLNLLKNTVGFLGAPFKAFGTFVGKAGTGILGIGKSIIGALPAIGAYIYRGGLHLRHGLQ
jgi:TP901 family phage tail tape measure protein